MASTNKHSHLDQPLPRGARRRETTIHSSGSRHHPRHLLRLRADRSQSYHAPSNEHHFRMLSRSGARPEPCVAPRGFRRGDSRGNSPSLDCPGSPLLQGLGDSRSSSGLVRMLLSPGVLAWISGIAPQHLASSLLSSLVPHWGGASLSKSFSYPATYISNSSSARQRPFPLSRRPSRRPFRPHLITKPNSSPAATTSTRSHPLVLSSVVPFGLRIESSTCSVPFRGDHVVSDLFLVYGLKQTFPRLCSFSFLPPSSYDHALLEIRTWFPRDYDSHIVAPCILGTRPIL